METQFSKFWWFFISDSFSMSDESVSQQLFEACEEVSISQQSFAETPRLFKYNFLPIWSSIEPINRKQKLHTKQSTWNTEMNTIGVNTQTLDRRWTNKNIKDAYNKVRRPCLKNAEFRKAFDPSKPVRLLSSPIERTHLQPLVTIR